MVRGSHAALRAAETAQVRDADCGEILLAAGRTWAAKASGTSGILWGAGLKALGKRFSGLLAITPEHLCAGMRDVYGAAARLGHAERGDKTMLDAMGPFNEVLETSINDGRPLAEAWDAAATRAITAAEQTSAMRPQVGRARAIGRTQRRQPRSRRYVAGYLPGSGR
jgi:D-erythrulose 4-kinase